MLYFVSFCGSGCGRREHLLLGADFRFEQTPPCLPPGPQRWPWCREPCGLTVAATRLCDCQEIAQFVCFSTYKTGSAGETGPAHAASRVLAPVGLQGQGTWGRMAVAALAASLRSGCVDSVLLGGRACGGHVCGEAVRSPLCVYLRRLQRATARPESGTVTTAASEVAREGPCFQASLPRGGRPPGLAENESRK